jgi:hypothetical protein
MGCWTLHKALDADESVNNLFSVSFDSLTPARLALRANLRLLYLKGPAFSIVVNPAELGFDAKKPPAVLRRAGGGIFWKPYLVSSRAAWAAARRATGTRNGEQLT